jgi:hypothetical protein
MERFQRTLRDVRDALLDNPVSPRVDTAADINATHYCRYVAETVAEQVEGEYDVEILEDGARGYAHVWLSVDGRHYDAECIEGVDDYTELPFFQRHPEAVMHTEPGTGRLSELRRRGFEPLYPDL